MSEANSASRVCEQTFGGSSEGRMRKLHKRKSSGQSRVMEGIIMKITETTISETEREQPVVRSLSASETEAGAFIHPTSGARRHRRKKIKSMETTEVVCDAKEKISRREERKTKKIKTSKLGRGKSTSGESEGDTGREGDDEMTDYCSGPEAATTTVAATTKPEFKVINWWDTETTEGNDEELNTILRGVMSLTSSPNLHLKPQPSSSSSSKSLRNRLGKFGVNSTRSQRRGRRRNKNNHHQQNNNGGDQPRGSQERLKRRKATSDEDVVLINNEVPIPATNIGYRMLTGMGWEPGSGLTRDSIKEPIMARGRRKRSAGLGL